MAGCCDRQRRAACRASRSSALSGPSETHAAGEMGLTGPGAASHGRTPRPDGRRQLVTRVFAACEAREGWSALSASRAQHSNEKEAKDGRIVNPRPSIHIGRPSESLKLAHCRARASTGRSAEGEDGRAELAGADPGDGSGSGSTGATDGRPAASSGPDDQPRTSRREPLAVEQGWERSRSPGLDGDVGLPSSGLSNGVSGCGGEAVGAEGGDSARASSDVLSAGVVG